MHGGTLLWDRLWYRVSLPIFRSAAARVFFSPGHCSTFWVCRRGQLLRCLWLDSSWWDMGIIWDMILGILLGTICLFERAAARFFSSCQSACAPMGWRNMKGLDRAVKAAVVASCCWAPGWWNSSSAAVRVWYFLSWGWPKVAAKLQRWEARLLGRGKTVATRCEKLPFPWQSQGAGWTCWLWGGCYH